MAEACRKCGVEPRAGKHRWCRECQRAARNKRSGLKVQERLEGYGLLLILALERAFSGPYASACLPRYVGKRRTTTS
jgi:hypothetical protein